MISTMFYQRFRSLILILLLAAGWVIPGAAQERPNILWLTWEDMSPYLGSYGNTVTHTPTLDSVASAGIRFNNAYSNGAQCSPARSTLISGIYAPTLATDLHREKRAVPDSFYFPIYLRKAGYYTTNNSKRDYNARNIPSNVWDESGNKATYLNRSADTPFFAVFNYGGTHTKRIATRDVEGRTPRTIAPRDVTLPPYLPNTSWIRDDIAWHYGSVNKLDLWISEKLRELEATGEAENTIIFFYSDHGGVLPRSKAYLYEVGTNIPLLVSVPEKYRHLVPMDIPSISDRLVSFVDFGPTILRLAGLEVPDFMEGKPFMGEGQTEHRKLVYLYRANQTSSFIPSRAITDGKYKLIWNFNTAYPNGARQGYQWQMPSYQSWDKACMLGRCNEAQSRFWEPMPALELYDITQDPYEVNNLADDPGAQEILEKYKKLLIDEMIRVKDLGLYPRSLRRRESSVPFYHYVRRTGQPYKEVIKTAILASEAQADDLEALIQKAGHSIGAVRYWAVVGMYQLLKNDKIDTLPVLVDRLWRRGDENIEVRIMAAEATVYAGHDNAPLDFLIRQVQKNTRYAYTALQNLGSRAEKAENRLKALYDDKNQKKFYLRSILINTGAIPYDALWSGDLDFNSPPTE